MINTTLQVTFKKTGDELNSELSSAIIKARKILFDNFNNGKELKPESITASKGLVPMTFCKYVFPDFTKSISSPEDFITSIYNEWIQKKSKRTPDLLKSLIPIPEMALAATQGGPMMRGFGLVLFLMWIQDAIILTPNFKLPTTTRFKGSLGNRVILGEALASEVFSHFLRYRTKAHAVTRRLLIHEELTYSLQNNLQSYGWRFLVSTDWHRIEDVNTVDALDFLREMSRNNKGECKYVTIPSPVDTMLRMIADAYPNRIKYDISDKPLVSSAYKAKNKNNEPFFSPESIDKFQVNTSDLVYYHSSKDDVKEWIKQQLNYINSRKRKGLKNSKVFYIDLGKLNKYLFSALPKHQKSKCIDINIPVPTDFSREYISGSDNIPSLIDFLEDSCKSKGSLYSCLLHIDQFFDYMASITRANKNKLFINPLVREIDFPITQKSKGTNKAALSQLYTPSLLSYVYGLYEFTWYVWDEILNDNRDVIEAVRIKNRGNYFDQRISCEDVGYVPFIIYREKVYPIKFIHKSLLCFSNRIQGNKCRINRLLPNPVHICQFLVAFETGIRNIHIRWFDRFMYDSLINRNSPLPPICPLVVNTDKVKKESWVSHVSQRVIKILDRLKESIETINEPWINTSYKYDDHKETRYDDIYPLFSKGGERLDDGTPFKHGSYSRVFKHIFFEYQEFVNDNELFDRDLDIAEKSVITVDSASGSEKKNVISSKYTPHTSRITLISNQIKILPPYVIGKYQTGHESEAVVAHYVVIDKEYMLHAVDSQKAALDGTHPLLSGELDAIGINAEAINSKLRHAIDINMSDAFSDFGAISFHKNEKEDNYTGVKIAEGLSTDQLAFNTTHICPYNNICPSEVKATTGEFNCGQCFASIKTVDHLTRILAHIRSLHNQVEEITSQLHDLIHGGECTDETLNLLELQRNRIASEEAAWIASHSILEEFRKTSELRDNYLVTKPEIIEKHLQLIATEESPLFNILSRIQDAKMHPEYLTPQLQSSIIRIRNKILAKTGDFDKLINQPEGLALIDDFRGLIRTICDASDISIEDLSTAIDAQLPQPKITLLEVI